MGGITVDFLKEWVRSLVMLVILASAMELLLPMNSMKKYVRMTLGLLVTLAVLQPAFTYLGKEVVVDTALFVNEDNDRLPSMGEIMARAAEFRERNTELALTEARARLAAEVRDAALAVEGVGEAAGSVTLAMKDGLYLIREVTVTYRPGAGPGAVRSVRPVRPVQLGESTPLPAEAIPAEGPVAEAVRLAVAQRLGLKPDPAIILVLSIQEPESTRREQP
jgi:stage III sporulation protein AF